MKNFQDFELRNTNTESLNTNTTALTDHQEAPKEPKTTLVSRNITVLGRRTSVRLEPEMWKALRDIAKREGCSIHDICSLISLRKNAQTSLTAAIRVFLMLYFKASSTEDGHARAGHGNIEFMKERARVPQSSISKFKNQVATGRRGNGLPMNGGDNGVGQHAY